MNAPTLVQFIAVFAAGHFFRGHDASGSADQERGILPALLEQLDLFERQR